MKKDNFLLKKTQHNVFIELSDEEAGKLIKGIYKYVNTGKSDLEGYLKIIFIPIKEEIDKNERAYEESCRRNQENGKLGGRPKKNKTDENRLVIEENHMVFEKTDKNPKNLTCHNHIHIHNQNQDLEDKGVIGEEETFRNTDDSSSLLEITKKVIKYLNEKANTNFRPGSKTTQAKIKARLNEGYHLDDFIVVIDKKTDEWLDNPDFNRYLCPETLFGTKFEKYLNQKVLKKSEKQSEKIKRFDNAHAEKLTEKEKEELDEFLSMFE